MSGPSPLDVPVDEIRHILRTGYGLDAEDVKVLSGELATVCRVVAHGRWYALKAMPVQGAEVHHVRWQTDVMQRLSKHGLPVPAVMPDLAGRALYEHVRGDVLVLMQLTEWLSDPPLGEVRVDRPLLKSVGETAAQVSMGLQGLEPPVPASHSWELVRTRESVGAVLDEVGDVRVAQLVREALDVFDRRLAPLLSHLPWCVVHHDLHDSNLLVGASPGGRRCITGILDFGDMVRAPRVAELSVAAAYAARNTTDPRGALIDVAAGWSSKLDLTRDEARALLPAAIARLAVNSAIWASRMSGPRASYARARVGGSTGALASLLEVEPRSFERDLAAGVADSHSGVSWKAAPRRPGARRRPRDPLPTTTVSPSFEKAWC